MESMKSLKLETGRDGTLSYNYTGASFVGVQY